MIEFFPPHNGHGERTITDDDIRHYTQKVETEGILPAQRIEAHYGCLLNSKSLMKNHTIHGSLFTTCVYDGLRAGGIPTEAMSLNMRAVEARVDDIDIMVSLRNGEKALLYLKTSLRERWKQVDRDARVACDRFANETILACITYAEHWRDYGDLASDPVKIARATRILGRYEKQAMVRGFHYIGVYETARLNALIATIAARCEYDDVDNL